MKFHIEWAGPLVCRFQPVLLRNSCRSAKADSICSTLASRHCRAGLSHAAALRLEHGLSHLDGVATSLVGEIDAVRAATSTA
jgi:hypothetical protein